MHWSTLRSDLDSLRNIYFSKYTLCINAVNWIFYLSSQWSKTILYLFPLLSLHHDDSNVRQSNAEEHHRKSRFTTLMHPEFFSTRRKHLGFNISIDVIEDIFDFLVIQYLVLLDRLFINNW